MSTAEILELLNFIEYDETCPSCFRWTAKLGKNAPAGKPAGSFYGQKLNKYWRIGYNKKAYGAHRVVWVLHNGEIPKGMVVDHIDGNTQNNKISNLRVVDYTDSNRNKGKDRRNKTGFTGINFDVVNKGKTTLCTAQLGNRKKSWSVQKYGLLPAMKFAILWRKEEISRVDLGYTDRHGN